MNKKQDKTPHTRRSFEGPWDKLDYLYEKLHYWLYNRNDKSKSRYFANLLEKHSRTIPNVFDSIRGNEYWALVSEARLKWDDACKYRKEEIRLTERMREISSKEETKANELLMQIYSAEYLSDRYDLLAISLWNDDRHKEALAALKHSEQICKEHGIEFDGGDIRKEILEEIEAAKKSDSN